MAFLKYAKARVVIPDIAPITWAKNVRVAKAKAGVKGNLSGGLIERASEYFGKSFDPSQYLLSHVTIVASCDNYTPSGVKLGAVQEDGFKVNRKFGGYRVKPECDAFINNNLDWWPRDVLLASYRTFIGGQNFCFAPGTEVLMADGSYKNIEDIEIGDSVISHTGKARKVTHAFSRDFTGDVQAIKIDRFKEPLVVTGNHPFRAVSVQVPPLHKRDKTKLSNALRYQKDQLVKRLREEPTAGIYQPRLYKVLGTLKEAGALTVRDLALRSGLPEPGLRSDILQKYSKLFASRPLMPNEHPELKKGRSRIRAWFIRPDAVIPSVILPSLQKDWVEAERLDGRTFLLGPERVLGVEHNPDLAFLLGYYLAEGCRLSIKEDKGVVLVFGAHELHLAKHAGELAEKCFPGTRVRLAPVRNGTQRVTLYGEEIGRELVRLGGIYSHSKRLDSSIFNWDRESLLNILAGWLSGDGSINKGTLRLLGTTVSEVLAKQMLYIANLCGIKASVVFVPMAIGEAQHQVVMTVGGIPRSFDVIARHHAWEMVISKGSATEILCQTQRWGTPLYDASLIKKRDDVAWWQNCRIHKVVKNTKVPYEGTVYNLETEEDHSYVVYPGVAVHNCEHVQLEELSKGRIIDAVARDVGSSVYVDILIATDRKHKKLIKAIKTGKMSTLSMGCFIPGTQVSMADGRRISIEEVQPGDMVLTHRGRAREVLNKQIRVGVWGVKQIKADGISNTITATDNHPFWVAGAWKRADALQVGDVLNTGDVEHPECFPITSIESAAYQGAVHNMEVAEDNSYLVEGVAVHNCRVDGTQCTKCGHWAADESELCSHIKYGKGNVFYDDNGWRHRVAEKCGDVSIAPTAGVHFIEASWVGTPAFTGAVLRNVIDFNDATADQAAKVLATPPVKWATKKYQKAAGKDEEVLQIAKRFSLAREGKVDITSTYAGWMDEDPAASEGGGEEGAPPESEGGEEGAPPAEPEGGAPAKAPPFQDLEDSVYKQIVDRVKFRLQNEVTPPKPKPPTSSTNETLNKLARLVYQMQLDNIVKTASSGAALIDKVASLNQQLGIDIPVPVYRAAVQAWDSSPNKTPNSFLWACQKKLGRKVRLSEARTFLRLGTLLFRMSGTTNNLEAESPKGVSQ